MPDGAKRALRSDAQRNRERLLSAAAPLSRVGGGELSLEQVARDAGVSIATLYRHFPTREALLLALSRDDAAAHSALAARLLATATPIRALEQWLHQMGRYGLTRPGMARAFRAAAADPTGDEVYHTTVDALAGLLEAGRRDGAIRSDLGADDVILALCGLWDLEDSPEARAQCDRLSGLLLDGLRRR